MRKTITVWLFGVVLALAAVMALGNRRQAVAAPVQQVVRSSQGVSTVPDFSTDPLPVKNVDEGFVHTRSVRPAEAQVAQIQPTYAPVSQIDVQRMQDASLLQEQQEASQRQQQELDKQIDEDVRAEQEMQAEQRIQEPPEQPLLAPPSQPLPVLPSTPQ